MLPHDPKSGSVYQSRADQVCSYLRERLEAGVWTESLPPERQLATELGVGRNTVRLAIQMLKKEGLVEERSQRGTFLKRDAPKGREGGRSVGIVFNSSAQHLIGKELTYFNEIQSFLADKGIELSANYTTYPRGGVSPHFRKMIFGASHALWILVSPSAPTERWCMENGIPAMLIGNGIDGGLPEIAMDLHAASRHAVGMFVAKGHRRIAMILPENEKGEDLLSRRGFSEAINESPHRDEITGHMEVHQMTKASVRNAIERLLALRKRPTALLVCRTGHYITTHSYLLKRGVDIPGEISLICRDHDVYLGDLEPEPSRYEYSRQRLARAAARLAYRLLKGTVLRGAPKSIVRIPPRFTTGETLAAAPRE